MIDGDEHRDLALTYDGRGQVGAPHRVYRRRDDGAVVVARASGCPDPGGREQVVRAHEPQHATLGCAKACHAQPGPNQPCPKLLSLSSSSPSCGSRPLTGCLSEPGSAAPETSVASVNEMAPNAAASEGMKANSG